MNITSTDISKIRVTHLSCKLCIYYDDNFIRCERDKQWLAHLGWFVKFRKVFFNVFRRLTTFTLLQMQLKWVILCTSHCMCKRLTNLVYWLLPVELFCMSIIINFSNNLAAFYTHYDSSGDFWNERGILSNNQQTTREYVVYSSCSGIISIWKKICLITEIRVHFTIHISDTSPVFV